MRYMFNGMRYHGKGYGYPDMVLCFAATVSAALLLRLEQKLNSHWMFPKGRQPRLPS